MIQTVRIPWLSDHHTHVSLYGALEGCPSIAGLGKGQALDLMRSLPEGKPSIVLGWHSGRVAFDAGELEALPPIVLMNISLHGFALTDKVKDLLRESQPEIVKHHTEPEWCERNLPHLLEFFSRTAMLTSGKLDHFMRKLGDLGLGAAEDMLLADEEALRVIQGSQWSQRIKCWASAETFKALSPEARQGVEGLKFFTDGALGARTAALSGPFLDGSRGLLIHSPAGLFTTLAEAHAFKKPVAIHAIGDEAIEQVLTALERLKQDGAEFPFVRLEHVQFIQENQARRAKALGLVLSMQPNFNSDSVDYADRLEPRWLETNNPFRLLIDHAGFVLGQDLIFGSDGMPHGLEYALQWSLFPPYPGQRLTIEELSAGYGPALEGRGHCVFEIDGEARSVRLLER